LFMRKTQNKVTKKSMASSHTTTGGTYE